MKTSVLSLITIFLFKLNSAARILGYVPTPSYSHQVAFHPLWQELSLRGHQVVVITTDPINNSSLTNLIEIDMRDISYEIWNRNLKGLFEKEGENIYNILKIMTKINIEIIDKQLGDPRVQAMIHNETEHFDLFMVEYYFPAILAFAERYKCPFIGMSSYEGLGVMHQAIGSPANPVTNPDIILPFQNKLTFTQRLTSVTLTLFNLINLYSVSQTTESTVNKHFGPNFSDMNKFSENMSMFFVNSEPIFSRVRPLSPNVIQFGGGTHLKPLQPLPENLKSFLDSAKDGFIYFSLGSNIKSKDLNPKTLQILIETFSELPYQVLWKFEINNLNDLPKNIKVTKWLPQQDVLRHPNIKLFITQGGLQSIEESLHCHVPIVGLPFFADQPANVMRAVDKGMGLSLDPFSLKKNEFKDTILEVIKNEKYRENAKQLSILIHDQPMTGLERTIWWTEYVIRHKGALHFKSPALDIPFYQYYLLDVIGFYIAILSIFIYVIFKLVQLLCRLCKFIFIRKSKIKLQ